MVMDGQDVAEEWAEDAKVLAVIVAYNSPEALERCLASLDSQHRQVDGVLVVDNSEPTAAEIKHLSFAIVERTRILRTGSNLGPAGGFALGLASFMEDGRYSHAWLMDDDCYPDSPALERILEVASTVRPGAAVFPAAVYEDTGVT